MFGAALQKADAIVLVAENGGAGEALLWSIADVLPAAVAAEGAAGTAAAAVRVSAGRLGFFVLRLLEATDALRRKLRRTAAKHALSQ